MEHFIESEGTQDVVHTLLELIQEQENLLPPKHQSLDSSNCYEVLPDSS